MPRNPSKIMAAPKPKKPKKAPTKKRVSKVVKKPKKTKGYDYADAGDVFMPLPHQERK